MKIIRKKTKPRGLRVIIYGVPGVGKTTLAAKLNNAVFMDYESGTHGIDCSKIATEDLPRSYAAVKGSFKEFKKDHMGFKNLVIDSADALEETFDKTVSAEKKIPGIFAVDDFFRTQKEHERNFASVLDEASELVDSGMNVVFVAHQQIRKAEPLESCGGKSYDYNDLKLSKKCSALIVQWADVIIFCAFKTYMIVGDAKGDKSHAGGGKRWCYCGYNPEWQSKHRACVDLPDDCSMDKMSDILPKILEESVDRVNGVTTAEMDSSEKKTNTKIAKDEPVVVKQEEKPVAKTVKPLAAELLKLIDQYSVDEQKLREYASGKLNDRYGIDFKSVEISDWPDDALAWLNRGMDKIASKIK